MKEKVILNRLNGEVEEKKVIAHFKILDDNRPNIKNIPILILDKQEMNNGNNVLEFMWEKDGIYQAINDENAWSEVKSVVVDIIKNNAKNLNYLSEENLKADIGPGRSLGLTIAQTDPLAANFKNLVSNTVPKESEPVKNETLDPVTPVVPNNDLPSVEETPTLDINNSQPVEQNPIVDNNPVFSFPESITNPPVEETPTPVVQNSQEEVIAPFASDAPAIETVINQQPVIESPNVDTISDVPTNGPEIIQTTKETDFDKMQQEIDLATEEYHEKIKSIIDAYKKKITETINEANILKEQATDHLKNAEAREQIATMAYQNSMSINKEAPSLQKIA